MRWRNKQPVSPPEGYKQQMRVVEKAAALFVAATAAITPSIVFAPVASADCPDIEVIFARGTDDSGGLGDVGGAFVNALSGKVGGRSVGSYAVNYPASYDFLWCRDRRQRRQRPRSVHDGRLPQHTPRARRLLAGRCGDGRHRRGADPGDRVQQPVAAQRTRFCRGHRSSSVIRRPSSGCRSRSSPVWGGRAIDLCNGDDPICQTNGESVAAHRSPSYTGGLVNTAADFVAGRV